MKRLGYRMGVLLALLWGAPLWAQGPTGTILGHVTDATSAGPIQGVSISIGGRSTVTRADGSFLVAGLPARTDTLRARMIGYAPLTQAVELAGGQTLTVDLVMTAQALNLSEMVVIGYGEQAAGNITGAVTAVTSEQFNPGRVVTPTELIQNKVAGVQVVENNEPGGGTTIRIRGATSVNASSDPLYVVDGVPLGTGSGTGISGGRDPLNFLNGNDIESITVLRDASAASIYGANAANGVVLITTKSGARSRKAQFEYSGTVSASVVTRTPSVLNPAQFRAAVQQFAPGQASQLLNANTDWFDLVDRTSYGQEQNFAVSGAGASNDYRLSASYLDQDGILESTTTKRVTLGVNFNQRLANDRFRVRLNLRGSRADDRFTPGGVLGNAVSFGPTQPVKDDTTVTGFYNYPGGRLTAPDNPLEILNLAIDRSTTYRSIGNVQADYSLPWIEGLRANLNLGYDITKADRETFDPSVLHRQLASDSGTQSRSNPTQSNKVLDAFLSYTAPRPVGPGTLDLTAGYSYSESHGEFPFFQAKKLSTDALGTGGIPTAQVFKNTLGVEDSKLISWFGRLNYNINDRYLAAFSVRRDGSSRFGKGHNWGNFPAASLGWRLSEESFLKGFAGLSDLKLRASWARTGNQAIANFLQFATFTVGDAQTQYSFGDTLVTTIRPGAVDKNIKWEATRSVDLGLDFGFANQRFTGAIDWYDKRTTDLLFTVPIAAGTNLSNFLTTNIGSMRNRGIEGSLSARFLDGGRHGLSWTADFTAARNKNTLLSINPQAGGGVKILTGGIAGGVGTNIQVLTPGEPINSFYVFEHKRDANGKPIYADENGDGTINDQDLYVDRNGDGNINQSDLRPFHSPAPKWILGHSSYLTYGKFDFGFTLRAYFGNYVYNNVASNNGYFEALSNGSAPRNLHTSVLSTNFVKPQFQSDFYVEKASFLRMDNLTLGYTFDIRGQSARIFGTLQNAFTITGYNGIDPTAGLNGIDNNIFPRSRTFTSGLTLRF